METYIVHYIPSYASQILEVWEQSVAATHKFLKPTDFLEIKTVLQDFPFEELEVFCLFVGDRLIGFIGINETKVEMLFLHPDYFGQGYGKQLMDFAISNYQVAFVDVNEQNTMARDFYENYGFVSYERTEKDDMGMDYPLLRMKLS